MRGAVSDADFVAAYRVPFQFRALVENTLPVGSLADETNGPLIRDLDGNWSYDLSGSYGVNLFGTDFYKRSIECAVARARDLGMVLGQYHPVVVENVERCATSPGSTKCHSTCPEQRP